MRLVSVVEQTAARSALSRLGSLTLPDLPVGQSQVNGNVGRPWLVIVGTDIMGTQDWMGNLNQLKPGRGEKVKIPG